MDFQRTSWMLTLGTFLSFCLLLYECSKLDGYKFPVWTTKSCPRNKTEWDDRSSFFNCNPESSYACLPNENFTELLEFCYPLQVISIQKGFCLYLPKDNSKVDAFNCSHFQQGCPTEHYRGSTIYNYPSCVSLGHGCFLQEPSCKSGTDTTARNSSEQIDNNNTDGESGVWVFITTSLLMVMIFIVAVTIFILHRRRQKLNRHKYEEKTDVVVQQPLLIDSTSQTNSKVQVNITNGDEKSAEVVQQSLLMDNRDKTHNKEIGYEMSIFNQWAQDDVCFYLTKAAREVESMIKHNNLVVVTGHSGSGKSAIIQHIALKYRKQGWTVKPVYTFEEIYSAYKSGSFQKERSLFVFNDPIGKESFDELLFDQWKRYRETINLLIIEVKLLLSCRKSIISDQRAKHFLKETLEIEIDNSQYVLSSEEKKAIFKRHMPDEKLTENELARISEVGIYFPLLCTLYKAESKHTENKLQVFTNPVTVLETELECYKDKDKEKYCGLVFLVLNNNEVCLDDLQRNPKLLSKGLQLCGLPSHTSPNRIIRKLESLKGFLVKRMGEKYTFFHDFVMEVTSFVFGSEYPQDTICFADLSFLRKRINFENSQNKAEDPFTIFLSEYHVSSLVKRLFEELFAERFIEVVLNPCLRNEQVISGMGTMLNGLDEQKMLHLINLKETNTEKLDLKRGKWDFSFSTLEFVCAETGLSPLFALIAFGHDELSTLCLTLLKQRHVGFKKSGLFPAICANGHKDFIRIFSKNEINECMEETWDNMYPIHIVSVFNNYNILDTFDETGTNVNMFTNDTLPWTPLMLASRIQTKQEMKANTLSNLSGSYQRDSTVKRLIKMGANVNLCNPEGYSPLYIACQNGHESTAQLLLNNGTGVNLCNNNGVSPLWTACQNGHVGTARLLLDNGADVNLCDEDGTSPLCIACKNGHECTAQLLLNHGADVNLCNSDRVSPLCIACCYGHESTVQLLLNKDAEVNLCNEDRTSPLWIACQNGHEATAQLLLNNGADVNSCNNNGESPLYIACCDGHVATAQLLLNKGADVNCCNNDGLSPLCFACYSGHESTVQLLLNNGADVNLCDNYGVSSLCIASRYGHEETAQLILNNGACVNLCNNDGVSPLWIACCFGHEGNAQILLNNGADLNLCNNDGVSPLNIACCSGHECTAKLLLDNGANVNLCDEDGTSPLWIACQNGHEGTAQLLLNNDANVNLCDENGLSPLGIACQNGHEGTAQLLVDNGANLNSYDNNGSSPLG